MIASVGIDVSKATLDAVLLVGEQICHRQVSNDEKGWRELHHWLQGQGVCEAHICMEATGVYSLPAGHYLYECGYTVSIVNPARTNAFGGSLLQRNKTDKSDAHIIALFCQRMKPDPWQPREPTHERLRELSRLAANLEADRQRCLNRLESIDDRSPVRRYLQQQIDLLTTQRCEVQTEINDLIESCPELKRKHDLLTSIVGIADKSAAALLGELPDLSRFDSARQLVAYAGLSPRRHESGGSVRRRAKLSKIGSARLRRLLYFPAITARRWNPHLKAFADRLTEEGKHKMVVIGAVMRKLLVLIYAILTSGKPYDRKYQFTA